MPQSGQVDNGSLEISYHSPLHEYISKIGWNSILGHHVRGLQDGIVKARSDVQELLCVELPRLRISLDATLPIGSREALSVILGDLEQAAWSLAESIDGKEYSDLFQQRKMLHGPWESLMHKMNQLERRASFYMVAISEQERAEQCDLSNEASPADSQPITPSSQASSPERAFRLSGWFTKATNEALYPDLLKQAVRDGRLKNSEKRSKNRWMHDVAEVAGEYPQYAEVLRVALEADSLG